MAREKSIDDDFQQEESVDLDTDFDGDQGADDEFAAEDYESSEGGDESWEEGAEDQTEEESSEENKKTKGKKASGGKKKSGTLVLVIGLVAALGLGGLYFVGMAGKGTTPQPSPAQDQGDIASAQEPAMPPQPYPAQQQAEQVAVESDEPVLANLTNDAGEPGLQGGLLNDPASTASLSDNVPKEVDAPVPVPTETLPDANEAVAELSPTAPELQAVTEALHVASETSTSVAPEVAAAQPASPLLPKAQDLIVQKEEVKAVPELSEQQTLAASSSDLSSKIDGLLSKMESLETRLSGMEKTIDDVLVKQASPTSGVEGSSVDVDALQNSIGAISDRIAALEKKASSTSARAKSFAESAVDDSEPVEKKIAPSLSPSSTDVGVASGVSRKEKAVSWVLRSAKPGEAMVSRSGESDIRKVVVGDRLSGLGVVKAIVKEGNRWVVQGSSGQLTN